MPEKKYEHSLRKKNGDVVKFRYTTQPAKLTQKEKDELVKQRFEDGLKAREQKVESNVVAEDDSGGK